MATRKELEQTGFLYGGNSSFIEELFARYLSDPASVEPSWRGYFDGLETEDRSLFNQAQAALQPRPSGAAQPHSSALGEPANLNRPLPSGSLDDEATKSLIRDHLRIIMLIRAYRVRGHLMAKLDPLKLGGTPHHPELDYHSYGFTDADLDREFYLDFVLGLETATLAEVMDVLQKTYSSTVGIEFLHIQDADQKSWLQQRIESAGGMFDTNAEEKRAILEHLTETEGFEQFLHVKFPGTKRFGLDGGESAIAAMETMIRRSAELGVDEIVIGMPHRGRLNVLANVMGKPYSAIFSEFQGGCRSRRRARLRRRQVPSRHLDRPGAAGRPRGPPLPHRQSRRISRRSTRWSWARFAPSSDRRTTSIARASWASSCMATPPSLARAWCTSAWRCRSSGATGSAARCI